MVELMRSRPKEKQKRSGIEMHDTQSDRAFLSLVTVGLVVVLVCIAYPLVYIVSSSFSSIEANYAGKVWLYPIHPTLDGYKKVFEYSGIWLAYANSFFYAVVGSAISLVLTLLIAYPLSRRDFRFRSAYMKLFAFTMIFQGGMIPTYFIVFKLGMLNTRWALLIPGAISVWNVIITRTFFIHTIPRELLDASRMDGCTDARFFINVVVPLSSAIIAVNFLFYAVGQWNNFFNPFLYLNDTRLFPLQLILRQILIQNSIDKSAQNWENIDPTDALARIGMRELLKYALIIVAALPVLCLYPIVQRYFVKGVMIGSIKG